MHVRFGIVAILMASCFVLASTAQAQAGDCESACMHVAECGGDFESCYEVCISSATQADIDTVLGASCAELGALGGADTNSGGSTGSGPSAERCEAACSRMDECGLGESGCVSECQAKASEADVDAVLGMSCDELSAVERAKSSGGSGGGYTPVHATAGLGCTGGDSTCKGINICCSRNGGAARSGESGTCMDAAVCNFPRR